MPVIKPMGPALGSLVVTVLLLAGGMALAPVGVYAAGGAIEVLQIEEEVNFPEGVELTLTAESDADIVEVTVFFRAASSRSWGYAYADFEPGSRVVARRSIPVGEAGYLAPGVDVEYFYRIRDADGGFLETERSTVEYLDNRFEWRRVNIGPLELVYHAIDDGRIADAARELERDLQRVVDLLQHKPSQDFKGVIYNSYADANAVFPVQSQTTTDQGTFAGFAFPEQRVFVGQGLDRRIIVHESTHILFEDALGDRAIDVPAWLNEGFATYSEPNVRIRGSGYLYGRTPPLRGMNRISGTPDTIPLFYQKSVSVVAYLIENYGEDSFRRMLGELRAGWTMEDALLTVYGFDVYGLEGRWAGLPVEPAATLAPPDAPRLSEPDAAADAAASAPQPRATAENGGLAPVAPAATAPPSPLPSAPPQERRDEPSPFVFFDVWILAGVALLAVSVIGFRFVYTRLRRNRRAEDDYSTGRDDWDF